MKILVVFGAHRPQPGAGLRLSGLVVVVPGHPQGLDRPGVEQRLGLCDRFLPHRKALLIGTASADADGYRKRRYDEAMRIQLLTGMMDYCGITDSELHLLYDVTGGDDLRRDHLEAARRLGTMCFGRSEA